ncbi:MAG: hypothetical protein OHK0046_10580 [Anaerolineae bacterium]
MLKTRNRMIFVTMLILLLAAFGWSLAAQDVDAGAVPVSAVVDDPNAYYGQTVAINGVIVSVEVDEAGVASLVDSDNMDAQQLPIFLAGNVQNIDLTSLGNNTAVQVVGVVREFIRTDFENEFGYNLSEPYYADYENQPAVVVDRIVRLDEMTMDTGTAAGDGGEMEQMDDSITELDRVMLENNAIWIDTVLDNPEAYYDQQVIVRGDLAAVDAYEPGTAALEDNDTLIQEQMPLFMSETATANNIDLFGFDEQEDVLVSATVRLFIREEFQDAYGYGLNDPYYDAYESGPVLMADNIRSVESILAEGAADGAGMVEGQVTVDQVLDAPNDYYGQTLTVVGDIINVGVYEVGTAALEDSDLTNAEELPIFMSTGTQEATFRNFEDDSAVRVTGTLRQFIAADFQNEFGFDLSDPYYADYENQPVMVVDQISAMETAEGAFDEGVSDPANLLDDVLDDPDAYYGQTLTVEGNLTSGDEYALGTAELVDDDTLNPEELQIFLSQNATDTEFGVYEDGARVQVTGTLYRFNQAEFQDTLGYDLSNPYFEDFDGEPAMIVDQITVMANE